MNALARALERDIPTLAVPFTGPVSDEDLLDVLGYAEVAEFRADYFEYAGRVDTASCAERISAIFPMIVTVRLATESGGLGGWHSTEQKRLNMFTMLEPVADGFDVELEALILKDVIGLAHAAGKTAIVSSHDFTGVPSLDELDDRLGRAKDAGADYFKLAARAPTELAYQRLKRFTRTHANDNVIVVAMGEKFGPRSRIELPGLGSRLTFAAGPTATTAPGQMSYQETHRLLCETYPAFADLYAFGE